MQDVVVSIIVPVYNEDRYIRAVLDRLAVGPYAAGQQEVIVVDDGSTDGTPAILSEYASRREFRVVRHPVNRGKGVAIRTGLAHARGNVIVVQDADLEYDPADIPALVTPIARGDCNAAYGSRYLRPSGTRPWTRFRAAVALMNAFVRLFYGTRLTDVNTCYKAAWAELYRGLDLRCERFEFCAEVTAKLCRQRVRIVEVPVSYRPRTRDEGKKIGWWDAVQFVATLTLWRFAACPDLRRFATPNCEFRTAARRQDSVTTIYET